MARLPVKDETNVSNEELVHGGCIVVTAGTPVPLHADLPCYQVLIQVPDSTAVTGNFFIGGAGVPNNKTAGIMLKNEDSLMLAVKNLNEVYVNATKNGEWVTYICWQN